MTYRRALVLARGLGRRMRAADADAALTPEQQRAADAGLKAMMPIDGRPFLDYVLSSLADAGMRDGRAGRAPGCTNPLRARTTQTRPPTPRPRRLRRPTRARAARPTPCWRRSAGRPVSRSSSLNADNLYPVAVLRDLAALDEPGLPGVRSRRSGRVEQHPAGARRSRSRCSRSTPRVPDPHRREARRTPTVAAAGRADARSA